MGVNLSVAIYTGFAGAIFFAVLPAIFKRKGFKRCAKIFIMYLILFTFLGYMAASFMDMQMSSPQFIDTQMSSPKRFKRKDAEHIEVRPLIHLQNVIMPNNKRS